MKILHRYWRRLMRRWHALVHGFRRHDPPDWAEDEPEPVETPRGSNLQRSTRRIVYFFGYLFATVRYFTLAVFERVFRGRFRQALPHLLWGMPALLLAGLLIGVTLESYRSNVPGQVFDRYEKRATQAFARQDYQAAQLYYQRALRIRPNEQEIELSLARTLEHTDPAAAATIYQRLAPVNKTGFGKAHYYLARQLLANSPISRQKALSAKNHLLRAIEAGIDQADVYFLLAQLQVQDGQRQQAVDTLLKGAPGIPKWRLAAAAELAAMKENDRARAEAVNARDDAARLLSRNPDDDEMRLTLAQAHVFLSEFPQAERTLQDGLDRRPGPALRKALAMVYIAWAKLYSRPEQVGDHFAKLERALELDPTNLTALNQLLATGNPNFSDAARQMLRQMIVDNKSTPLAHLTLGLDAWSRNEQEEAKHHLDQAHRLNPAADIIANNLAFILLRSNPPDLEQALRLMDEVVARSPDLPQYRDTRGQIYAAMKRWPEALDDLVRAQPIMQRNPEYHRLISEVYQQLGMEDLSARHRAHAESIASAAGQNAPSGEVQNR